MSYIPISLFLASIICFFILVPLSLKMGNYTNAKDEAAPPNKAPIIFIFIGLLLLFVSMAISIILRMTTSTFIISKINKKVFDAVQS